MLCILLNPLMLHALDYFRNLFQIDSQLRLLDQRLLLLLLTMMMLPLHMDHMRM